MSNQDQPRWGAVAIMTDLETGETKETCMYCYKPWHYEHFCEEPLTPADAAGTIPSSPPEVCSQP